MKSLRHKRECGKGVTSESGMELELGGASEYGYLGSVSNGREPELPLNRGEGGSSSNARGLVKLRIKACGVHFL
jgi:hypothetical protein